MHRWVRRRSVAAATLLSAASLLSSAAMGQSYYATELGFRPTDINAFGQVVGTIDANGVNGAVKLWTPGQAGGVSGSTRTLYTRSGSAVDYVPGRIGLNDAGQVVGPPVASSGTAQLWTPAKANDSVSPGTFRSLPGVNGVFDINNAGTILGTPANYDGDGAFFLRLRATSPTAYATDPLTIPFPNYMPGATHAALAESGRVMLSVETYETLMPDFDKVHDYGVEFPAAVGQPSTIFDRMPKYLVGARDQDEAGTIVGYDKDDAVSWSRDLNTGEWVERRIITSSNQQVFTAEHINERGQVTGFDATRTESGSLIPMNEYAWIGDLDGNRRRFDDMLDPVSGAGLRVYMTDGLNDAGQVIARAYRTDAATFQTVWLLLTPGKAGDADFSGRVDFADLLALAKSYNGRAKTWRDGDFTGDGAVGFDDLLLLAKNYQGAAGTALADADVSGAFAADFALAQSLVPEPGAGLAVIALASLPLRGRRR